MTITKIEDDGSSYDRAWHIHPAMAEEVLSKAGPPHGEYFATAEGNAARRANDRLNGVYQGP